MWLAISDPLFKSQKFINPRSYLNSWFEQQCFNVRNYDKIIYLYHQF